MPSRLGTAFATMGVLALAAGCSVPGSGGRVDVLDATRTAPDAVRLSAASCNQDPFAAEVEETAPGTYEVSVETRLPDNGEDCDDPVTIKIDPAHPTVLIVDRSSGNSFDLLGTGQVAPLGLNGVWRLTTVDIGHPVIVGQTTAEIPEITIRAGAESGTVEGNFGCNLTSPPACTSTETTSKSGGRTPTPCSNASHHRSTRWPPP